MNPMRPPFDPETALDLTRAILARTSGSPCDRLRDQACAYVDGELGSSQAGLMDAHMEHCAACAALVVALATSKTVLPELVQLDPGPWFTQRILRATLYAPRPGLDLRALWLKLMHRPRIALEAGYLGAAMGLMGLTMPMPNLPVEGRAHAIVQALSPNHLAQPLKGPVERVVGPAIQAEQRTAASLQRAFLASDASALRAPVAASAWQRCSLSLHAWFHSSRNVQKLSPEAGENPSKPTNP